MKRLFYILCLVAISLIARAQNTAGNKLQISIITCSPGQDLYSIFGHTAIRIIDSNNNEDLFFNYGTFTFDDDFYFNFIKGKLDYYLNTDKANDFFSFYNNQENRTITEQVLSLLPSQKIDIYKTLVVNITGNNKFYKYDFLFDNCTTRARDVLLKHGVISNHFQLVKKGTTYRNMLHQYLDSGGMCWSKLGIDILLGSKIDKPVSNKTSSFLPDYLMKIADSCNKKTNLISKVNVYNKKERPAIGISNYIPLIIFGCLAIGFLVLWFSKHKLATSILMGYVKFVLFITGLLGVVLLFMWLGTDHKSCAINLNLLWALPTNLIALFLMNKKSELVKNYFFIAMLNCGALLVFFKMIPQQLNIALFPFILTHFFIYKLLYDKSKKYS